MNTLSSFRKGEKLYTIDDKPPNQFVAHFEHMQQSILTPNNFLDNMVGGMAPESREVRG